MSAAERAALSDHAWFTDHPWRWYRVRLSSEGRWVIIRRRAGFMLRAIARALPQAPPDDDDVLRCLWIQTAWACLDAAAQAALVKQIKKSEPSRGRFTRRAAA